MRVRTVDRIEGRPLVHYAALGVAVLCSVLLVAVAPRHSPLAIGLVVGATLACGVLAVWERRTPRLGVRPVMAAIALVFAVAVVKPPTTSNDLWSYGMYGRMVTVHDANPYVAVPNDFRSDPLFDRVSPIWQHRPSVFGPVWVGYEAVGSLLMGSSPLGTRLFFQLTAAAAAVAVLVLIWRRTRSTAALVWLGLHPMFGAVAINGGHNDVVIGLGILAGALLAGRRWGGAAGFVLGLVALIKITALLALVGVVLWAYRQRRWRVAATATAGAAAALVIGYLPFVGDAAHVLANSDHTVTPGSLWNGVTDLLLGHNAWSDVLHPLAYNGTLDAIFWVSVVTVAVVALVLGFRAGREGSPRPAVGAATASYPMAAGYAQPWYSSWSLPVFTDAAPSPLAWVVWIQAAVMLAALKLPTQWDGSVVEVFARALLSYVAPLALFVAFVVVGLRARPGAVGP